VVVDEWVMVVKLRAEGRVVISGIVLSGWACDDDTHGRCTHH